MSEEEYAPIIGLEVHVELATASKMFCGCSAQYFGHEPNTHVCPVCLGLPGALPVPNRKVIEWCMILGLVLNCQIPQVSKFDRKNYFYPDLPKGYQISQYDLPFCTNGWLEVSGKQIGIRRVHQEEDTAKLIHQLGTQNYTLVDFNRSGVSLVEIVTEPDIHSAQEAKLFLQKLQQVIRYLGISDCDMEKGSMRLEPNISLKLKAQSAKGKTTTQKSKVEEELPPYKVEIKNINSFRFVERAIEYEIKRQREILEKSGKVTQETRGWDERKMRTLSQRGKEKAHDYRYFPEPDIPPFRWTKSQIRQLADQIQELPDLKLGRFKKQYGLSDYDAKILTRERETADYFEEAIRVSREVSSIKYQVLSKTIANWIINKKVDINKVLPAELIQTILSSTQTTTIVEEELEKIIKLVLLDNPRAVSDYRKGKTAVVGFLVGEVRKTIGRSVNPLEIRKTIEEIIKNG